MFSCLLVLAFLVLGSSSFVLSSTQQPAFRSRITIVPIDVRVLDADGKPIVDLERNDFTILENGVPQGITHFSSQALVAEAPDPKESLREPALRASPAEGLKPQNRRIFLIQLGRGRMKGPSKELPALLSFLRTKLLPQDYVAVMAWNRATDFTRDHAKLAAVIERYRERADRVESQLEGHFSGLRAVYGSRTIPPHIQAEINNVFAEASALRPREITPGQITDGSRVAGDVRQTADELLRAEIARERGDSAALPDPAATATAERLDATFDEYVARQVELTQDVSNIYAGIDYMRHLDGEKHLVFVTPKGLLMPRVEDDRNIAARASDARVAIDIIYTGGMPGAPPPRFSSGRGVTMSPLPSTASMFNHTFSVQALRLISELTGGQSAAFRYADEALNRIDQSTRHQYLLGYAPSNGAMDGRLRNIVVKVNRPGVTVLHRRHYYATTQVVPLDRRQFVTQQRLASAGRYTGIVKDIEVTLVSAEFAGDAREVRFEINIKSPRTTFKETSGVRTASIEIAIYCGDPRERIVCESHNTMDLKFGPEPFERFLKTGASFKGGIAVTGEPRYVKVIAYDYGADLLGTATKKLK
ncbi:MAG TPA: VWA domain-containing protein [Vicinamibacterales bacterium]